MVEQDNYMTYNIATPLPSVSVIANAIYAVASYAQPKTMWEDGDGRVHVLCSMATGPFWTHHVSIDTDGSLYDNVLVSTGVPYGQMSRRQIFDSTRSKLYTSTEYHDGYSGSALMFDQATQTWTIIKTGTAYGTASSTAFAAGLSMDLGDDGLVYMTFVTLNYTGMRVYSFDPDVGTASWYDYGIIYNADAHADGAGVFNNSTSVDSNVNGLGVDTGYIYVSIQGAVVDSYYHLRVHPIGSGSWSEVTFGDGLASTAMGMCREISTNDIYLYRTPSGQSAAWYQLTAGGATPSDPPGAYRDAGGSEYVTTNQTMNGFTNVYGYDVDVWDVFPTPVPTNSIITWQPHGGGSPPWSTQSSLAYAGDFASGLVCALATNSAPGEITSLGGQNSSGAGSDYNYKTDTSGASFNALDAYGAIGVPAAFSPLGVREIYWVSYPDSITRWIPSVGLTRTNPKVINVQSQVGLFAYPNIVDYDANKLIWFGGNICGSTAGCEDCGSVCWYDPSDDSIDNVMDALWIGGNPPPPVGYNNILFVSMCMANSCSKVVVSGNDGYIHVIDCATKTIDRSTDIGISGYLVEVSNDLVMGITDSVSGNKMFRYQPSTGTLVTAATSISILGIPSITATFGGVAAKHRKLELGPDGYAWLFVDDDIYRVHPTSTDASTFTKVIDTAANGIGKIKWSGTDLLVYYDGTTNRSGVDVYLDLLTTPRGRFVYGVENVKPYGKDAGKVYGVAL